MPKERILVADDEPDVLDVALRALRREGYEVMGVPNGAAAVEAARQQPYDLLVADVKMPGMSGLRAYRLIKGFSPGTLCLIVTGYGTLETAIEAVRLGVDAFILKPFGPAELCTAVGRALERRRLAQENSRLRALLPVHELTRALVATTDLDRLGREVVELATRETGADACTLWLLNEETQELCVAASQGEGTNPGSPSRCRVGEGLVGAAAQKGQPVPADRVPAEPGICENGYLCLPLVSMGKAVGVLSLHIPDDGQGLSRADSELLSIIANGAAVAIQNALLFSRLQQAYERLAELDHRKSEFINLAAHELRSPLAAVITYATLMEENPAENAREHLPVILDAARRLQVLLDDMLNLRNLDTSSVRLQPEPVSLGAAAEQAVSSLARRAAAKGHTVQVRLPDGLPPLHADPEKLQIILLNLLSNAIKFTPDGGHISLTARSEGSELILSLSDTGVGIPEGERERIFERFYQVEDSLRREHGGLGLGLSIVKGMVTLHGGRIWVESRLGEGSTFHVALPACIPQSGQEMACGPQAT
ncbi:MAG: ATP-binding protein [Anaerolineae bacterium]